MKKLRDLKGMPVLSLQEGERLGQVGDLIVDPATGQVVALILDQRSSAGEHQVVATANVHNVGDAAITVEDRSTVVPLSRIPRFKELARTKKPIRGKMIITENGARLGHIADLLVDPQTFRVTAFLLKGFLRREENIPIDRVRTIGVDAVVVREEPEVPIRPVRPTPMPTVAAPPPEATAEPAPEPPEPAPLLEEEPAMKAEPEPEPTLPPEEPCVALAEEDIEQDTEPAVPSVSTLSSTAPVSPSEPLPPAEESGVLTPPEEPLPRFTPDEPLPEEDAEQSPENPWQRWVRRLRRREEE